MVSASAVIQKNRGNRAKNIAKRKRPILSGRVILLVSDGLKYSFIPDPLEVTPAFSVAVRILVDDGHNRIDVGISYSLVSDFAHRDR